jgi:tRNA A-37 threonylcarbamoyl transferase component Bud32
MSWAGESIEDEWRHTPVLRPKVERIRGEMRRLRVNHGDFESRNILQDGQGKLMVIDFELATRMKARPIKVTNSVKVPQGGIAKSAETKRTSR